jgi:hypothetical protein
VLLSWGHLQWTYERGLSAHWHAKKDKFEDGLATRLEQLLLPLLDTFMDRPLDISVL